MHKRDQAILDLVRKMKPESYSSMARILEEAPEGAPSMDALIHFVFEAGRVFQKENPDAPDGPSAYIDD